MIGFLKVYIQFVAFILGLLTIVGFLGEDGFFIIPYLIEELPKGIVLALGILLVFAIFTVVFSNIFSRFQNRKKKHKSIKDCKPIYEDGYQIINGVKASRPQKELAKMITNCSDLELERHCNVKVGNYYLDIIYIFCGDKIVVEYDGIHWHQEKNGKRDAELIKHGYKVLHLESDRDVTNKEFALGLFVLTVSDKQTFTYRCI